MTDIDQILKEAGETTIHNLKRLGKTVTTAESCTGGMIASTMVGVSGASGVLWGSFVTYMPEAKHCMIHVSNTTMNKYGLVSKETAKEMVLGALKCSGTDYAISVTGLAGSADNMKYVNPVNESDVKDPDHGKPIGLVYIACASLFERKVIIRKFLFRGSRNMIRKKAAVKALQMLNDEFLL